MSGTKENGQEKLHKTSAYRSKQMLQMNVALPVETWIFWRRWSSSLVKEKAACLSKDGYMQFDGFLLLKGKN